MANFITASRPVGANYYEWSAPEYWGRESRTDTIKVVTLDTSPIYSASTAFTQNGHGPYIQTHSVASLHPVVNSGAGTCAYEFQTNTAQIDFYCSQSSELLKLEFQGQTIQSGFTGSGVSIPDTGRDHKRITFEGDPGTGSLITFALTFSYAANPYAYDISASIYCFSGSNQSYVIWVTQSAATGQISVDTGSVTTSSKGGSGIINVTSNARWAISESDVIPS